MHRLEFRAEEKLAVLESILRSQTFRRSEQLRQFLNYVVREEIEGRGAEIREWDIAVRALGRPENYSPDTDSAVRTRAHALRQKLAEYYESEALDSNVRIEIPRGTYAPHFLRVSEPIEPEPPPPPESIPAVKTGPVAPSFGSSSAIVLGIAAGLAIASIGLAAMLLLGLLRWTPEKRAQAPIRTVWGPILDSPGSVRIVVASPMQLWIRDFGANPPPVVEPRNLAPVPPIPGWPAILRDNLPIHEDSKFYLHPNNAGTLWGDAAGAIVATRFLESHGTRTELVPERSLKGDYLLRGANVLVFGQPEYSALIRSRTPQNGLTVGYYAAARRFAIIDIATEGREVHLFPQDPPRMNYGLITIHRHSADDGRESQFVAFSGVISIGSQAAIEYLTAEPHAREVWSKLKAAGAKRWPRTLQVVVRVYTTDYYPLRTEYVTHRVLEP